MTFYNGYNFINGKRDVFERKETFISENPSDGKEYGAFTFSSPENVQAAISAARHAFAHWQKVSRVERAEYFDKLAQLLKRDHDKLKVAISLETGKNLNESHAEVIEALHMCQYVAADGRRPYGECVASEISDKDAKVIRKPKGVVAVISPWNFPLAIGSFWSSAPAIVEGNCVVHKPSELTPMVASMVSDLYLEAGFPDGVYNLIHGDGTVGEQLVHGNVDVILFTGSAEVGQLIRKHCAETWNKTCSCECGSKSAVIVFDEPGNGNLAIDSCLASAFKLSGQRCVSSGRILVQRSMFDYFTSAFVGVVRARATFGNPFDEPAPFFGPLINSEQKAKVQSFNELVRNDSDAEVLYDNPTDKTSGHFLSPFVYTCEWMEKPFLKQEVFGPHVAIIPFDDVNDAVRIYNDTDYGLALGVISDNYRIHRIIEQECTTGMLYINGGSVAAESHLPFSSWKKSGNSASAAATWKSVTHTMAVTTNYGDVLHFAQGMKL